MEICLSSYLAFFFRHRKNEAKKEAGLKKKTRGEKNLHLAKATHYLLFNTGFLTLAHKSGAF